MAFPGTVTRLDQNSGASQPQATAPIIFVQDRLYVVAVIVHDTDGSASAPTISGGGQGWSSWPSTQPGNDPEWQVRMFSCVGVTGSGVLSISSSGMDACLWIVFEVTLADPANALPQVVTGESAGVPTSLTITLPNPFQSADSATFGIFGKNDSSVITAGSGFTDIGEVNASGMALTAIWKTTNDSTVDASETGSADWSGYGFEVKALVLAQTVFPDSIGTGESVPEPVVVKGVRNVPVDTIATGEVVPSPSRVWVSRAYPDSVSSEASIPNPTILGALVVIPGSVPTGESIPSVGIGVIIRPDTVPTGELLRNPILQGANQTVEPVEWVDTSAVYNPGVGVSSVTILPDLVGSGESFYTPFVNLPAIGLGHFFPPSNRPRLSPPPEVGGAKR